ncbi:MAG: hypothetical protein GY820_36640 [Gammaproteobacteria bacterium]|nr:hypothetical protein [Gammaproteobacteria bacterium]
MNRSKSISIAFFSLCCLSFSTYAELLDQGLNSIMLIIDKAIDDVSKVDEASNELSAAELVVNQDNASATIVNLSRTLGTLSYSRLQCGEAGVLAEFTQRVQQMPEERRDTMRNAFQEGFDKSKADTPLLSEDECKRLTESRKRDDKAEEANVTSDDKPQQATASEEAIEEEPEEDPKEALLRIAEITGQLAYKRKFCDDKKVFTRDFNEYISGVPEEYQEEVKTAYWKGFKHGKRLNKNLTRSQCN